MPMSHEPNRVFVVEDDPAVRDSLAALLDSAGHKARSFATASDFLRISRTIREGCLLLDICLPDMDAFEVLQKLTAEGARLPVILITGHGHLARKARAQQVGAFAVFEKPVNDCELLEAVERALHPCVCRRER